MVIKSCKAKPPIGSDYLLPQVSTKIGVGSSDKKLYMKIIIQSKNKYILRYDKGEEVITDLINFCENQDIEAGFFFGIGAAEKVTISFYDTDIKEYKDEMIEEKVEIVNLLGNIAKMGDKIIIHCHGAFSGQNMQLRGGHVKKLVVSATCEIFLENFDVNIEREFSPEIGLNLMK